MSTLARGRTHLALIQFLTTDLKTEELQTLLCDNSVDGDTLIDAIVHLGALSCVAALKDYFHTDAPVGQLGRLGIILGVFVVGEMAARKVEKKGKTAVRSEAKQLAWDAAVALEEAGQLPDQQWRPLPHGPDGGAQLARTHEQTAEGFFGRGRG